MIEISLNGKDFSFQSNVNFRYYESLLSFDFRPSGGPINGNTAVDFFSTDDLNGFQRLNDGEFSGIFANTVVKCENYETELILDDDFDVNNQINSLEETGGKQPVRGLLDQKYWQNGSGVKSGNTCGSKSARGIWFAAMTSGNEQGFGAILVSTNSSSNALTFTGTSSFAWSGRYAISNDLDLSRGFTARLSIGHADNAWPNTCDRPEYLDTLNLIKKPVSYHPEAVPPRINQRKFWDVVQTWAITNTSSSENPSSHTVKMKAERTPLGKERTLEDLITCPKDTVCNSIRSHLTLFQGSHGQGPFDVWVVDDMSVWSFGGITSDSRAICKSPSQSTSGAVEVQISLNGQQFQKAHNKFQYYRQPSINSVSPSGGHLSGGTVFTISGQGFQAYFDARFPPKCKLAFSSVIATVFSDRSMVCKSPENAIVGFVKTAVALNGVDFTIDTSSWQGVSYIYYDHPLLSNIFPDSGPNRGKTIVQIVGNGFIMLFPQNPFCRFTSVHNPNASTVVEAKYVNNSLIYCITPDMTFEFLDEEAVVQAVVEISLNGQEYTSENKLFFTYYREVSVTAAEQIEWGNTKVMNGGDPVTVHGTRLRYDQETRSSDQC
jgi:hypothetical protein